MPLKLLPHKSWHVYNQANVARVKHDEAMAEQAQLGLEHRAMVADSEARVQRMRRKRSRTDDVDRDRSGEKQLERQLSGHPNRRNPDADDDDHDEQRERRPDGAKRTRPASASDDSMMTRGHVNFWAHLEQPGSSSRALENAASVTATTTRQKTKEETDFDNLTKVYLAKKGEREPKGWYDTQDGLTERERVEGEEKKLERTYRDNETKRLTDPLALMNSYLSRREALKSGTLPASSLRRQPSMRDRYLEPLSERERSRGSTSIDARTEDELEPVVEKLLGERRRRQGDDDAPSRARPGKMDPPPCPRSRPSPSSASSTNSTSTVPASEASLRVASERARTAALLASRRRALASSSSTSAGSSVASTPRSQYGAHEGGFGMFNREEVREAQAQRARGKGSGSSNAWDKDQSGRGRGGWADRKERRQGREKESRTARAKGR
ncbi:hypothetical protein JCM10212_003009 [Sporobolomyces blumeae]